MIKFVVVELLILWIIKEEKIEDKGKGKDVFKDEGLLLLFIIFVVKRELSDGSGGISSLDILVESFFLLLGRF